MLNVEVCRLAGAVSTKPEWDNWGASQVENHWRSATLFTFMFPMIFRCKCQRENEGKQTKKKQKSNFSRLTLHPVDHLFRAPLGYRLHGFFKGGQNHRNRMCQKVRREWKSWRRRDCHILSSKVGDVVFVDGLYTWDWLKAELESVATPPRRLVGQRSMLRSLVPSDRGRNEHSGE